MSREIVNAERKLNAEVAAIHAIILEHLLEERVGGERHENAYTTETRMRLQVLVLLSLIQNYTIAFVLDLARNSCPHVNLVRLPHKKRDEHRHGFHTNRATVNYVLP